MKVATNQERLIELFDADPRNDSAIAASLGVSKQTVSSWRSGTRSPKKPMLIEICRQFNVSIEWLMGFDVEKTPSGDKKIPIIIPNTEAFVKIVHYMPEEDYQMVMAAFERAEKRMREEEGGDR